MLIVIDRIVQARFCGPAAGGRAVSATLGYQGDDPYAVRLSFPPAASLDGREATWVFARALLRAGLRVPSGAGDVQAWPCGPDRVMVEFRAPEGSALLEFPAAAVRDFLARSYAAVPAGEEHRHLDTDNALAALLADG